MNISDILRGKSAQVHTITGTSGVRDLLAVLAEHNIGAVVVSSDGVAIEGIVSERDVVRHLHHDGTVVNNTVGAIMTPAAEVATCSPDDDLDAVLSVMTERRIRHLPVVDGDRAVGIVSIGDLVKAKIDQLQFERDQLDAYVMQG